MADTSDFVPMEPLVIDATAKHINYEGHECDQIAPGVYKPCEPYEILMDDWSFAEEHRNMAFVSELAPHDPPMNNDPVMLLYFANPYGVDTLWNMADEIRATGKRVLSVMCIPLEPFERPSVIWQLK